MTLINFIDYAGTLVFAISGVLAAVDKKFDLFGAIIMGMVTAIGGGTLRDLMIGSTPVSWLLNEVYFALILSAIPITYFFKNKIMAWRKGIFLFDTVGIAMFTILGLQKTMAIGLSPVVGVLMGVVSAVFGGVIRDVLSNEVPLIFRKEVYAFACFAGALIFLGISLFAPPYVATIVSIITVIVIRVLAIQRHWEIPFNVR